MSEIDWGMQGAVHCPDWLMELWVQLDLDRGACVNNTLTAAAAAAAAGAPFSAVTGGGRGQARARAACRAGSARTGIF